MKKIPILALLLALISLKGMATVVYVDHANTSGFQDGSSWAAAFTNPQNAINAANAGDSIWIAQGNYPLANGTSYTMKEGVKIFGGFLNTYTSFAQRNWQTNVTILKGNNNSVIDNSSNNLTPAAVLDGVTITGGKAQSGGGMLNNSSSPTVANCIFLKDTCASYGAGMCNLASSPVVSNCTFSNNTGAIYGAGMYNGVSAAIVSNCSFNNNAAKQFWYTNPPSLYESYGGGMYNYASHTNINNCTFSANTSDDYGGGIASASDSSLILNCNFLNNSAKNGGAGYSNSTSTHFNSCTFSNNTAKNYGGGIYNYAVSTALNFNLCNFSGNKVILSTNYTGSSFYGGGAIYNYGSSPTITSCAFLSNTVNITGTGTTVYAYSCGGAIYNYASSPIINGCTVSNNGVSSNSQSSSGSYGGGMYNDGASNPTSNNCTFSNNSATGHSSASSWYSVFAYGGGVYNTMSSSQFTQCVFNANTCSSSSGTSANNLEGGSGMYNAAGSSPVLTQCTFSNHISNQNGGGIYNEDGVQVLVKQCIFSKNKGVAGGGIYNLSASAKITDCNFTRNSSTLGGAILNKFIYDPSYAGKISNCTFSANKSTEIGGAICNSIAGVDGYVISNCSFKNDTAKSGAGIYNFYSSPAISNVSFVQNIATISGAGIYNDTASSPIITNALFSQNMAASNGGAIYNANASPKIINSTIVRNKANTNGSGIYSVGFSSPLISNTILWGNFSGIYSGGSSLTTAKYSLIQGFPASAVSHLIAGTTNPLFVDTSGIGNYQLQSISPCINLGSNDSIPLSIVTDLAGNGRIYNATVDMGAYEYGLFPPVVDLGNYISQCTGSSALLDAGNPGATYLWNNGATTQTISVNNSGIYYVVVTNSFGSASDTIQITTLSSPTVSLGNDTSFCTGSSIFLNAQNPGMAYLWNTGASTQTISVSNTGTYSVAVTGANTCIGRDTIVVSTIASPNVNLGNDVSISTGSTITLDAGNIGVTYLWSTGETTQTITVSSGGTYSVTVTNSNGCSATDAIVVSVGNVGIGIVAEEDNILSVNPNPATEILYINISNPKLLQTIAKLYDSYGRIVKTVHIQSKSQQLSLNGLVQGMYILKLENGQALKIVKE